ncbi:MAG: hypothetical protein SOV61_03785 [Lachnospiraceae bacterium]|nr:hypothetical protein [Lachnospiraceae bacterium]MDY2698645.1 hypothetical protein [Lachnospiraceae bacterium]MDY4095148.1 hypothetical protein [Lachnospiraceae bacterium]
MGHFMKANKVSRYNMRMMKENIRIPFILLIAVLYVMESLSAVLTFSRIVHIDVTPFAFVFLINNYRIQFIIAACAVILFCNAPFEDESYQYMISRAGMLSWGLGQIFYIIKMSLLYIGCLVAATIVPFLGHITWSNEWGKIWGTLGKTNAGAEFGVELSISQNIIREYEPVDALFISILLEFSCILCIGLIIYFGNKMTGKSAGTVIGALIAVLDICVSNDWLDWAYGFSPVSLTQLELFNGYASKWGINLAYAEKFFLISILSLSALCVASNYKEKIVNKINRRRTVGR